MNKRYGPEHSMSEYISTIVLEAIIIIALIIIGIFLNNIGEKIMNINNSITEKVFYTQELKDGGY